MATFPGAIATFRTMVNRVGVLYDALKTKVIYAEDLNNLADEVVAIENALGANLGNIGLNGWQAIATIPTLQSSDDPNFVLRFGADMTAILAIGQKIKLTQNSAVKYFIVVAVGAYTGGNTDVDVYGGTDYDMENTGTYPVTLPNYSLVRAPFGFPMSPIKWTFSFSDTASRTQSNPTTNQWYNLGSLSLNIPKGAWYVSYALSGSHSKTSAGALALFSTLSTSNNSESDSDFSIFAALSATAILATMYFSLMRQKVLVLTSKTTYYLLAKQNQAGTSNAITFHNDLVPAVVNCVCAYL
jgi:hypothetical protein